LCPLNQPYARAKEMCRIFIAIAKELHSKVLFFAAFMPYHRVVEMAFAQNPLSGIVWDSFSADLSGRPRLFAKFRLTRIKIMKEVSGSFLVAEDLSQIGRIRRFGTCIGLRIHS